MGVMLSNPSEPIQLDTGHANVVSLFQVRSPSLLLYAQVVVILHLSVGHIWEKAGPSSTATLLGRS